MAKALEDLLSDSLRLIASFLSGRDALRLSFSSSSLRSALPLVPLPPLPVPLPPLPMVPLLRFNWSGDLSDERGDRPCPSRYLLPILFPDRTHSILVRCQWGNQGLGGQVFIGAERDGPSGVPSATNAEPPHSQQRQQQQQQQQQHQQPNQQQMQQQHQMQQQQQHQMQQQQHMQQQHQMQQRQHMQQQRQQQQQQELEERTQLLVEFPHVAPRELAPVSLEIASASIFAAGLRLPCRLWYKVAGGGDNLPVFDLKVEVLVYDDFDDAKNKEGIVRKPFLQSYRAILRCTGDSHVASRFLDPLDGLSRSARSLTIPATQWGVYPEDYSFFPPPPMHGLQTAPNHPTQHNSEATNSLVGTFLRLFLAVVRRENELLCRDDTLKTALAQMGLTATDKGCLRAAQEIALKLQSL